MKPISIIVAVAENWAIGKNNDLLCHLPGDLKRFKELTSGHPVLMGQNTYLSLPKRPLPNRKNIVLSLDENWSAEGIVKVDSIDKAVAECDTEVENFVMGGGMIYKLFLPIANKLYLTRIHHIFDADIYFPEVDFSKWKLESSEPILAEGENPYNFTHEIWVRTN